MPYPIDDTYACENMLLGQPENRSAYPVALFHRHLAMLHYKLGNLDATGEKANVLFPTADVFKNLSRDYLVAVTDRQNMPEYERCEASENYIASCIGQEVDQEVDCAAFTTVGTEDIPFVVCEFGLKGKSSIIQCAKVYAENLFY